VWEGRWDSEGEKSQSENGGPQRIGQVKRRRQWCPPRNFRGGGVRQLRGACQEGAAVGGGAVAQPIVKVKCLRPMEHVQRVWGGKTPGAGVPAMWWELPLVGFSPFGSRGNGAPKGLCS